MNKFIVIICTFLLIAPVIATESQSNIKIGGSAGAFITNSDRSSTVSSGSVGFMTGGENWNEQTAGTRIVTLGLTKYQEKTVTNNKIENSLISNTEIEYDNGAAIDQTFTMTDNKANIPDIMCDAGQNQPTTSMGANGSTIIEGQTPAYQSTEAHYSSIGAQAGRYKTGAVIDDANMSTAMRAQSNGGGTTATVTTKVMTGFNKSSDVMNFEKDERSHTAWFDYGESGFDASIDTDWTDHSKSFMTKSNSSVVANRTVNETVINETVNLTV